MQLFVEAFAPFFADDGLEFGERGLLDFFDAAQAGEEEGFGLLADALDEVEFGGYLALGTLLAVEGDGKAVHLVLHTREEVEEGAVGLDGD